MNKVLVLLSGGIDSTTALYDAVKKYETVTAVSFNYGSKHNKRELKFAAFHCKTLNVRHEVIELSFMNNLFKSDLLKSGGDIPDGHYQEQSMKQTVVPFRNGIMLSIAAGFAESIEADGIVIAAHAGDHTIYPDCREEFMTAIAQAINLGTYANIKILRPFIDIDKTAIVKLGQTLKVPYQYTYSCYKGYESHCGNCGTCVERKEAFQLSGIADPTDYISDKEEQAESHQEESPQADSQVD